MNTASSFKVTAPGRVFLFGEHSDYFNLQVISAALNYSINAEVSKRDDTRVNVEYENLHEHDSFEITETVSYRHKRDYLRSAFNVLKRKKILPSTGADIKISGTIPIAAGLSSSSALSVASILAFAHLSKKKLTNFEIGELAFEAEVVEFNESGGMMDHLASIFGGIIHVDFSRNTRLTKLNQNITGLVIGDSLEKKEDTVGDIKIIKATVEQGFKTIKKQLPSFDRSITSLDKVIPYLEKMDDKIRLMTETTLRNRDLTRKALNYLQQGTMDPIIFGKMLNSHHLLLRDGLERSTPKLEKLIKASLDAGALGAKMNGSGGGGTMLAYAPGDEKSIAKAISDAGGKPYHIKISTGASIS